MIVDVSSAITDGGEGKRGDGSGPTTAFLLKMGAGIDSASHAPNRRMMGLGLFEDNNPFAANHNDQLVAGLHLQGSSSKASLPLLTF